MILVGVEGHSVLDKFSRAYVLQKGLHVSPWNLGSCSLVQNALLSRSSCCFLIGRKLTPPPHWRDHLRAGNTRILILPDLDAEGKERDAVFLLIIDQPTHLQFHFEAWSNVQKMRVHIWLFALHQNLCSWGSQNAKIYMKHLRVSKA